jgi:hypothetical protein
MKYFGNYILVHFYWSKAIQFGERKVICPLFRLKESGLWPVSAYELMTSFKFHRQNDLFFSLKGESFI